jgi:hypothetical protein
LFLMTAAAGADPIAHGQDIRPEMVGPAAAGYTSLVPARGGVIRDGESYPFARLVERSAEYDGLKVAGPHLLIERAAFSDSLDIYARRPVVLRGSVVRLTHGAHSAIQARPGSGPLYILWSDVGGAGDASIGTALKLRSKGGVVWRSHISRAADAIQISGTGIHIGETLIGDLTSRPGDHNDAVQILPGASRITIDRCRIVNPHPQTSCIFNQGNDIAVESSYLAGGGWVIYGGAGRNGQGGKNARGVKILNNVFGLDFHPKSGNFGVVTYWNAEPDAQNEWSGNTYSDGRSATP